MSWVLVDHGSQWLSYDQHQHRPLHLLHHTQYYHEPAHHQTPPSMCASPPRAWQWCGYKRRYRLQWIRCMIESCAWSTIQSGNPEGWWLDLGWYRCYQAWSPRSRPHGVMRMWGEDAAPAGVGEGFCGAAVSRLYLLPSYLLHQRMKSWIALPWWGDVCVAGGDASWVGCEETRGNLLWWSNLNHSPLPERTSLHHRREEDRLSTLHVHNDIKQENHIRTQVMKSYRNQRTWDKVKSSRWYSHWFISLCIWTE